MYNLIKPKYEIITPIDREQILKFIEVCGRTCYKSEDKITEDSAKKFVKMIVKRGHNSVIEHFNISVRFYCDRGVSHEMVRHRIASYSQESTRYCNYSEDKKGINYIDMKHHFKNSKSIDIWLDTLLYLENQYNKMIELGESPQIARSILPNCLKTEIVSTYNLRQWVWVFSQRCSLAAHPQMRELMIPLQREFQKTLPEIFGENNE
jgi:thymidylate synthase (FAD)